MKKGLKLFLPLLLCTVLLSGCYPSGSQSRLEKISSSSNGISQNETIEIKSKNENLSFKATPHISQEKTTALSLDKEKRGCFFL